MLDRLQIPEIDTGVAIEPAAPGTRYLHPGAFVFSTRPTKVTTILGSCVAICLYDEVRGAGGLNHFLLPGESAPAESSAKYSRFAFEKLLDAALATGSRKADLTAKVFGGSCVLDAFAGKAEHLGRKNVIAAIDLLTLAGIRIVAEDTGGRRGRKLIFDTATGAALIRLL